MRKSTFFVLFCSISAILATYVMAQSKYSIRQMTPEVSSALENRKARFEQLRELKAQGVIGENNQGYLTVLVEGKGAEEVVQKENDDRKVIYQTIAEQNDLKDELQTIETVFAQVQRDKSISGDQLQNEDGSWITK
jgi:uncharacterized protein YdbL (DUF1318 family)